MLENTEMIYASINQTLKNFKKRGFCKKNLVFACIIHKIVLSLQCDSEESNFVQLKAHGCKSITRHNVIMTSFNNIHIEINENVKTYEYRLMYLFGAWITKEVICAENDTEAIFDADMTYNASGLQDWKHNVALFRGNQLIKSYK